jgi:hypothetical protein
MNARQLERELQSLHAQATELWSEYLARGPGQIPISRLAPLDGHVEATQRLLTSLPDRVLQHAIPQPVRDDLKSAIDDVHALLHQAVESTAGLCFVIGEAGLIPRQELHTRLGDAMTKIELVLADVSSSH